MYLVLFDTPGFDLLLGVGQVGEQVLDIVYLIGFFAFH
jgi:hypothetical protein